MKKITVLTIVSLLVFSLAGAVAFANPAPQQTQNGWYCPYWGQQTANLTDAQKEELAAYQQKMVATKKQMLQKEVEWGWITQAQADGYLAAMSQHMVNGPMYGHGMMGGMGMMGAGRTGTHCW